MRSQLDRFLDATTLIERLDAFAELVLWTRAGGQAGHERLLTVVATLESDAVLRERFQSAVAAVFSETNDVPLFAEAGLPTDRGLFTEAGNRILKRVLPPPRGEHDLARLLARLFPKESDARLFGALGRPEFARIVALFAGDGTAPAWSSLVCDMRDAFHLLGVRVQALGLASHLRSRSRPVAVVDSPFVALHRRGDALLSALAGDGDPIAAELTWREAAKACRAELGYVTGQLQQEGISTQVVYAIDVIRKSLLRMEALASVLVTPPGTDRAAAIQRLVALIIEGHLSDRSLRALARDSQELLARKIVERAGHTGEHYIANSRREYGGLWLAALGGGLITAGTAAFKMAITARHLPLFVEGTLAALNYAVSFLLIYRLGFVLATKQPAMTAATFAGIVRATEGRERGEELVTFISRICRSQLAAALGNIVAVIAGVVALDLFWRLVLHAPRVDAEEAEHIYHSLAPLTSGTVLYAALTGVILWLSSLAAGWFENWVVSQHVAQAIAEHPWGEQLGRNRLERFGAALQVHAAGWGGNVALGVMLGVTPIAGKFFGLPLDVRHVTLSTGTLALSASGLGEGWLRGGWFAYAAAGIAVTFVLNLTVSFALALAVALRAYGVSGKDGRLVLRAAVGRFVRRPWEFVLPPGKHESGAAHR